MSDGSSELTGPRLYLSDLAGSIGEASVSVRHAASERTWNSISSDPFAGRRRRRWLGRLPKARRMTPFERSTAFSEIKELSLEHVHRSSLRSRHEVIESVRQVAV